MKSKDVYSEVFLYGVFWIGNENDIDLLIFTEGLSQPETDSKTEPEKVENEYL